MALDINSLAVAPGEVVAVTGALADQQGLLLELLSGKARPTAGTLEIGGLEPATAGERLSGQVGFLFSQNALYERQSALANLELHCRLHGLPLARAREALADVGLADQAAVPVRKLASGLARRLAFGRAILHRPKALILAEPFAGCDLASVELLSRLIRHQAEVGTAVLILAAEVAGWAGLCDQVVVLERGRAGQIYRPGEGGRGDLPTKVPARLEGKVALVNPADIVYISAEDGKTTLYTTSGALPTQFNLGELEERLGRSGFFRAHRGYLVNLQRIKEVIAYTRDSYSLILDGGGGPAVEIPLSKSSARELRELLGY
jgi:ABC-2 type transport system ATP-binding protein